MEFRGKIALVTGAGQGIGKAIALGLAGEGADVVVNDLNLGLAESMAKEIRGTSSKAMAIHILKTYLNKKQRIERRKI